MGIKELSGSVKVIVRFDFNSIVSKNIIKIYQNEGVHTRYFCRCSCRIRCSWGIKLVFFLIFLFSSILFDFSRTWVNFIVFSNEIKICVHFSNSFLFFKLFHIHEIGRQNQVGQRWYLQKIVPNQWQIKTIRKRRWQIKETNGNQWWIVRSNWCLLGKLGLGWQRRSHRWRHVLSLRLLVASFQLGNHFYSIIHQIEWQLNWKIN